MIIIIIKKLIITTSNTIDIYAILCEPKFDAIYIYQFITFHTRASEIIFEPIIIQYTQLG